MGAVPFKLVQSVQQAKDLDAAFRRGLPTKPPGYNCPGHWCANPDCFESHRLEAMHAAIEKDLADLERQERIDAGNRERRRTAINKVNK